VWRAGPHRQHGGRRHRAAARTASDVLLSDIGLPSEDGYALIRRVREIDPAVPAAALTAYASADDQRRALAEGFHAHVPKPVEPARLALLVASLSGRIAATLSPPGPPGRQVAAG